MTVKRICIVAVSAVVVFVIYLLWRNALIIDDIHPASSHVIQGEYSPGNHYHIHIDLDELKMYVYNGEQLVATYPVSGGSTYTPSPIGEWIVTSKDTWGEGFGGAWMGFNVPWGEYGIHGTECPWFIGKSNSSKGCIRMYNKDVKELFKIIPHGTTVTIVQENRTFRTLRNGDVGSDVKEVQVLLKELGYYVGYPDGIFGYYLENAIRKFQNDNKLWASGTVYKNAYNLIIEKALEVAGQSETEPNQ